MNRDLPYWDVWVGDALLGTEEVGFPPLEDVERILALPSGWNEIAIANESSPGVWSEPYRFYVE